MAILLWLVPAAGTTLLAMVWVAWAGRAGRGEVDRDAAVRRMGEALSRPMVVRRVPARPHEPSTGVAVRRPRDDEPAVSPVSRRSA